MKRKKMWSADKEPEKKRGQSYYRLYRWCKIRGFLAPQLCTVALVYANQYVVDRIVDTLNEHYEEVG